MNRFGVSFTGTKKCFIVFLLVCSLTFSYSFSKSNVNSFSSTPSFNTLFDEMLRKSLEKSKNELPQVNLNKFSDNNRLEIEVSPNQVMRIESFKYFCETYKPSTPQFQREPLQERIDSLYGIILDYRDTLIENNNFQELEKYPVPFLNFLHVGVHNNEYKILDGQHRFRALLQFYLDHDKDIDFNIWYVLKKCDSINSMIKYYQDINNHLPMSEIIAMKNGLEAYEILKVHIKTKYFAHLSNSDKPRFPNINVDQVVSFVIDYIKAGSRNEMMDEDINFRDIVDVFEKLNHISGENLKETDFPKYVAASTKPKQGLYIGEMIQQSPMQQNSSLKNNAIKDKRHTNKNISH